MPSKKINLFTSQQELLTAGYCESNRDWLICAPTGSGKTLMAEWAFEQTIIQGRAAAYVAPLKAIVEERHEDWETRFTEWKIGLFTGETTRSLKQRKKPDSENLLLFTPEKLAGYLHSWKRNLGWLSQLGVLVVDEFHLLGDPGRGSSLEALINRIKRINPFIRIIGLTGTLSNAEEISQWMGAKLFVTNWRPVPVERTIKRFRKLEEKFAILADEVASTTANDGKVLVFVNSRKRSERLSEKLGELGFKAGYNHAGLDRKVRMDVQETMRQGEYDVLVSTSSLEMGVNFPARKVVVYDSYGFNGETFAPLSVQRYLQASGRAGRAGYDTEGESVLLLPVWSGKSPNYETGVPEPVESAFFRKSEHLKEILNEVSGRLSISGRHLETNFARRTLWRAQGGKKDLGEQIELLLKEGLLARSGKKESYLNVTPLGKIAAQMGVSPFTVIHLARFFQAVPVPQDFDLLLTTCLVEEVSPKLGFNFEEIDHMGDLILETPSDLLDSPCNDLPGTPDSLQGRQLLSAVKCATILLAHSNGRSLEELAETFDCYPADLALLKNSLNWVLGVSQRIFGHLRRAFIKEQLGEIPEDEPPAESVIEKRCRSLSLMIEHGVPRESLSLVRIKGIGNRRANQLLSAGICSAGNLLEAKVTDLSEVLGLKQATIEKMLESAQEVVDEEQSEDPFDLSAEPSPTPSNGKSSIPESTWNSGIDPYRLRRALELRVELKTAELVRIVGGTEPHGVGYQRDHKGRHAYVCDCADYVKGTLQCKHVLRTRLELGDDADLLPLLRQLNHEADRPLRYSLGRLWMETGKLYDAFNGREVDYEGKKFLRKAKRPNR